MYTHIEMKKENKKSGDFSSFTFKIKKIKESFLSFIFF